MEMHEIRPSWIFLNVLAGFSHTETHWRTRSTPQFLVGNQFLFPFPLLFIFLSLRFPLFFHSIILPLGNHYVWDFYWVSLELGIRFTFIHGADEKRKLTWIAVQLLTNIFFVSLSLLNPFFFIISLGIYLLLFEGRSCSPSSLLGHPFSGP